MRIDQFLVVSRVIKRRSVAQEFCEQGRVRVNRAEAKSSKEIKTGDEIEIKRNREKLTLGVLKVPVTKQVPKADLTTLFEIVSVEEIEQEFP
jgi:ribosomal 50S subunit-recycling heat shock protein